MQFFVDELLILYTVNCFIKPQLSHRTIHFVKRSLGIFIIVYPKYLQTIGFTFSVQAIQNLKHEQHVELTHLANNEFFYILVFRIVFKQ
ncbi:unnamed protein product [Schistosoma mattheei]|uniref:Uncharacterized protein n=1 Tax=Schistosoma mattheei TaxID=31246 RepID=A0A183P7L6_9TREM|nr:unnamed protein product [Schistosoma mattheei]